MNWLLDAFKKIMEFDGKVDGNVVFEAVCLKSDVWDTVYYLSPLHGVVFGSDRFVSRGKVSIDDILMMLVYLNPSPSEIYRKYRDLLETFTNLLGYHLVTLFRQHNCNTVLSPLQKASEPMTPQVKIISMIRRLVSAKESVQQTATILLGLQKRGNTLFRLIGRDVTKYISRNVKYSYWDEIKTKDDKEYE
jgi:hypothetical protein